MVYSANHCAGQHGETGPKRPSYYCYDYDLVGAVRTAELLDGFVRRPRQLQSDVQSPPLVANAAVRLPWFIGFRVCRV